MKWYYFWQNCLADRTLWRQWDMGIIRIRQLKSILLPKHMYKENAANLFSEPFFENAQ